MLGAAAATPFFYSSRFATPGSPFGDSGFEGVLLQGMKGSQYTGAIRMKARVPPKVGRFNSLPRAHDQLDSHLCAFHMCKRFCAFLYVLLDMCEPYVRLICACFTKSVFKCFPLFPREATENPPGSLQEAPREPPGESTYPPLGGLLWGPPFGPPLGASRGASSGGLPAKPA